MMVRAVLNQRHPSANNRPRISLPVILIRMATWTWLAHDYSYENNLSIYLNDGQGQFQESARFSVDGTPHEFAIGDLNADGDLDLGVRHNSGYDGNGAGMTALLAQGNGQFAVAPIREHDLVGFAIDSLDESAADEIVSLSSTGVIDVTRYTTSDFLPAEIQVISFDEPIEPDTSNWNRLATGDWNGDGLDDVIQVNESSPGGVLQQTFVLGVAHDDGSYDWIELPQPTSAITGSWTIADLTGDGLVDIGVVSQNADFTADFIVLPQLTDGQVGGAKSARLPKGSSSILNVDDLNSDGIPDVMMLHRKVSVNLYFGMGAGEFSSPTTVGTFSNVHLVDLNGDRRLDIVTYGPPKLRTLISQPDGTFTEAFSAPSTGSPALVGFYWRWVCRCDHWQPDGTPRADGQWRRHLQAGSRHSHFLQHGRWLSRLSNLVRHGNTGRTERPYDYRWQALSALARSNRRHVGPGGGSTSRCGF